MSSFTGKSLLKHYKSTHLELNNRFVMAPLTRQRASTGLTPSALNALYYGQRATAGLIISEASQISPKGMGYSNTPGIYSKNQVEGWKLVTDAVHRAGGKVFCQLWHVGRHSHPLLQADGGMPLAPSAVSEPGTITTPGGKVPTVVPLAMSADQIRSTVEDYAAAASNAMAAGFDGVEIHAANGYLIEQFLNDNSNQRTDSYGGSIENKIRFALEVTEAVVQTIGNHRTGIRLSPSGRNFGLNNEQPIATFELLLEKLAAFDLAYHHLIEPDFKNLSLLPAQYAKAVAKHFRPLISTTLIISGGFDFQRAETVIESGEADLVAFGSYFIANPDLVKRYQRGAALNAPDISTYYGGGEKGYTDYPFLND